MQSWAKWAMLEILPMLSFKVYYRHSHKTSWYWLENRHMKQWTRLENLVIHRHIFSHLILDEITRKIYWWQIRLFKNWMTPRKGLSARFSSANSKTGKKWNSISIYHRVKNLLKVDQRPRWILQTIRNISRYWHK